MRPAVFAISCLGLLAACGEPNATIDPVTVQWMDWPAEVNAGQPFRTRLVVWGVCALNPQFRAGASADQSVATPVKPPLPVTPDGVQAAPPPPRIDFGSDEDFQLKQALNQLKGSPVITSTKALQAQATQTQAVPTKP